MTRIDLVQEVNAGFDKAYVLFGPVKKGTGFFSQFYPAPFTIDGVRYPTAEHYMMAGKARLFNDHASLNKIMSAATPQKAKALGRKVAGFDEGIWRAHCTDIVVTANLAKFSQNHQMREFLMRTGTAVLVEASATDCIWGIGLARADERAEDPRRWKGENLLGFCLMRVRDILADEYAE